jgi:glycosyltransferase involved in cell wall biosynthesis
MKVLFVTQWYPSRQQPHFGIFVREHARAIITAGHQVHVLALTLHASPKPLAFKVNQYIDNYGINVTHGELHSVFKDILYHLPFFQQFFLLKIMKTAFSVTGKPEIIHSNVIYPAGMWGHEIAQKLNLPHFITEHWSRLNDFKKSIYFKKGRGAYFKSAGILPVSNFLKSSIQQLVPELNIDHFHIIGNVVDTSVFKYSEIKKADDTLRFCAVATWQHKNTPDKLPELFIEALASLKLKEKRAIKLIMIGGGDKVDELKKLCLAKGIKAQFTGFISKETIAEHLAQTDFFLHASTIETFSIVVAEALASGVPVVCSATGALPELVNESNGILCENNLQSWEDALQKIVQQPYDRAKIASALKDKFSPAAIGKAIDSVYNTLNR